MPDKPKDDDTRDDLPPVEEAPEPDPGDTLVPRLVLACPICDLSACGHNLPYRYRPEAAE